MQRTSDFPSALFTHRLAPVLAALGRAPSYCTGARSKYGKEGVLLWNLQRLLISAFVTFHLAAVTLWIVPICALKAQCVPVIARYLMPLAQWQYWGMFAPDPVHNTVTLEAVVLDANNILHSFAFPTEASRSRLNATLHYRHSKYAANFSNPEEFRAHREFGARHVLRQLHLTAEVFPVQVQLMYRIWPTPPPGTMPDPMLQPTLEVIDTYRFPTLQEALP